MATKIDADLQDDLRVMKVRTNTFGSGVVLTVAGHASNHHTLSIKFPLGDPDAGRVDPLSPTEDKYSKTTFRFERRIDGDWQEIEDPRMSLELVTALNQL
ncbi:MAG: hypothetical protein ACOH18_03125 [Candidatus Saccharimonadaceae bacterium]